MAYYRYTYGSFSANFARLTTSEQNLYADDGISQVGVKYDFQIQGWITGSTPDLFAAALNDAHCQCQTPRLALTIQWSLDNATWTTLYAFTSANDLDFGPKPGLFAVQQFVGGRAATYSWSVSASAKVCWGLSCLAAGLPSQVLSVVRKWDHAIDPNGFTRRTLTGTLVVTAQSVNANQPADSFRNTVIPPVPLNFKREHQNFQQSANGRELSFTIVDQETRWTLPQPITGGRASFTVHVDGYGATGTYTLSGRFEAPASVDKQVILQRISELVISRFPAVTPGVTVIPSSRDLTEDVYGNAIDFNIVRTSALGNRNNPNPDVDLLSGIPFGQKPPGSDGIAQEIAPYGSANLISGAPPIYDACGSSLSPGSGGGGGAANGTPGNTQTPGNAASPGNYGGDGSQYPTDTTVPATNSGISAQHAANMWVAYHEECSYEIDQGIVVFDAKVSGSAPLLQRARNPRLTVIQAGYQSQMALGVADLSPVPDPILGIDGALIHSSVTAASSETSGGSAWNLYTSRWCYTMVFTQSPPAPDGGSESQYPIIYPNDPRLSDPSGGNMVNPPNLLPSSA